MWIEILIDFGEELNCSFFLLFLLGLVYLKENIPSNAWGLLLFLDKLELELVHI